MDARLTVLPSKSHLKKLQHYMELPNCAIHYHVPLCIGYTSSLSKEEFSAIADYLIYRKQEGIDSSVYHSDNQENQTAWRDFELVNEQSLIKLREANIKIINLADFRASDFNQEIMEYKEAIFNNISAQKALDYDIQYYQSYHPEVQKQASEKIEHHIKDEAIDPLLFARYKEEGKQHTFNVMYHYSCLTKSMEKVLEWGMAKKLKFLSHFHSTQCKIGVANTATNSAHLPEKNSPPQFPVVHNKIMQPGSPPSIGAILADMVVSLKERQVSNDVIGEILGISFDSMTRSRAPAGSPPVSSAALVSMFRGREGVMSRSQPPGKLGKNKTMEPSARIVDEQGRDISLLGRRVVR